MSENNVTIFDGGQPSTRIANHQSGGLLPTDIDQAWRIAQAVAGSGLAPRDYNNNPKAAMFAIMHGMEIGLKPMQAIQNIAVINGKPSVYGDGIIALVRGSGLCRYVKEWIDGEGDDRTAWCETHRQGESEPIARPFSVQDAKDAGLWNKQGPWKQYPKRMLQMRARAFCLRDAYADVLDGIMVREEVEDYQDVTPAPPPPVAASPAEGSVPDSPAEPSAPQMGKTEAARALYKELQQDIDSTTTESELQLWGHNRKADIEELPNDWQREIRERYKSKLIDHRNNPIEATEVYDLEGQESEHAPF